MDKNCSIGKSGKHALVSLQTYARKSIVRWELVAHPQNKQLSSSAEGRGQTPIFVVCRRIGNRALPRHDLGLRMGLVVTSASELLG
jgi:hypothetical protein